MAGKMRKVVMRDGRGVISVGEEPIPEPKPGQVLVDVKVSLISPGTELGGVKRSRENPSDGPARPFGYANAGVVIGQGEGAEDVPIGTRVACMGGGYAEHASHACVPVNMAVAIPEKVSFEEAAFNHLAVTALNAVRRVEVQIGENAAVVGLGVVGQCACQWLRLAGCHVMGLDTLPMRVERAVEMGVHRAINVTEEDAVAVSKAFTRGYGVDAAVMAFGGDATGALKTLVQMMKRTPDTHIMGRVGLIAGTITHGFGAALGNLDLRCVARTGPGYHDEEWEHGADYPPVFVPWTTKRNIEEFLRLVEEGALRVEPLITHRVPIDEAPEACEVLIQRPNEALGVALIP